MSWLPTPILNHDIVIYIFHLNTHTPENETGYYHPQKGVSALQTTRHTSQVCRSWRQIILQSPTIWANVIDVGTLNKAENHWFEEVFKRTGEAKLSIYGQVENPSTMEMLASLVVENWDRMRRINIHILADNFGIMNLEYEPFWAIFWTRQPPTLETLIVHVDQNFSFDRGGGFELFSGSAPSLRRIHSPSFPFDHRATWISQLRSVTLSETFRMTEALEVIAKSPLLESVVIKAQVENDEGLVDWTRNLHLPNLHRIDLSSNIMGANIFLSHITPCHGCALRLSIADNLNQLKNTDTLRPLSDIVSRYAKHYFLVHSPAKLGVGISPFFFAISSSIDEGLPVYFGHPVFSINVSPVGSLDCAAIDILLFAFAPTSLQTVIDFRFKVFQGDSKLSYTPSKESSPMFRTLTAVKRMKLMASALDTLNELSGSASFSPHLVEMTVDDTPNDVRDFIQKLRVFLSKRKDAGHPLQALFLPEPLHQCIMEEPSFTQEFDGLEIGISKGEESEIW